MKETMNMAMEMMKIPPKIITDENSNLFCLFTVADHMCMLR